MVNLTIDGKKIEVQEGTTVLRAAEAAGVTIPTLCDHKELTPYGGCRLCLVEVEGARTLQPSCTMPVSNNMVVRTDTDKVRKAREFVLTLLFSERNHFCPFCQVSGGDCELQNSAYREGMTHWPLSPNFQTYQVDASNPYFVLDNNRCILCRRCVRACGELVGNFTLGFEERGASSLLVADFNAPLGESSCVSCGTCVQVCPTGALIDRQSAYRGKVTLVETTETVCLGCSVGCTVNVLTRDNNLVRIEGAWGKGVSDGLLCKSGRFLPLEETRQRLTTPLVRKNGALKAATWEEAMNVVSSALKPLAGKGKDGVAALVSTRLPVETLHAFKQVFENGLKSNVVTSIEEGFPVANSALLAEELGKPFEGKLDSLQNADTVLIIGSNLAENHQVAGFFVKRNISQGTRLIVVDPNSNELDSVAELSLKPANGADVEFITALRAALQNPDPSKLASLAAKAGITAEELLKAAELLSAVGKTVFVFGKGLEAGRNGKVAVKALLDLSGLVKGSCVINTKGQANSLAAAQLGLDQPFTVNGHQAAFLALGDDFPTDRLAQKLEGVPFLVVQASHASKLTAKADVVLPVEMWTELSGHFVNLDGTVQEARKSLNAPEDVWSNDKVIFELAERVGVKMTGDWMDSLHSRPSSVELVNS